MTDILPDVLGGANRLIETIPVILIGSNGAAIAANGGVNGLVTIDAIHRQIHLGRMFEASHYEASIADAANFDVLVIAGASGAHLRMQANVGGSARARFYEEPTTSANGTAITTMNRNRNSAAVPTTAIYYGPTVSVAGTLLSDEYAPGGSAGGQRTIGSTLPTFEEWILAPNTKYLMRITNASGSAIGIGLSMAFYEVVD